MFCDLRHLGRQLRRAGSAADHRHALAGEIHVMPPARGMKRNAAKMFPAFNPSKSRLAELAAGAHETPGGDLFSRRHSNVPNLTRFIPRSLHHLRAETNMRGHP